MKTIVLYAAVVVLMAGTLCAQKRRQSLYTPEYTYRVVHVFPHDTSAFTQGLAYRNGFLYEGTGLNGRSSVRKVRLETGEIVAKTDLPSEFFGEGITVFGNEIIQLTWVSHKGFVYNLDDLSRKASFSYAGEDGGSRPMAMHCS